MVIRAGAPSDGASGSSTGSGTANRSMWTRSGAMPWSSRLRSTMSMNGVGAAEVEVGVVAHPRERGDGAGVDEPLVDVEVVHELEPPGVPVGQVVELGREDRAVPVAVGVEEVDPAARRWPGRP